jgi:hypothetical protein
MIIQLTNHLRELLTDSNNDAIFQQTGDNWKGARSHQIVPSKNLIEYNANYTIV